MTEYIISLYFGNIHEYYIRFNETNWQEVYSPHVATVFTNKKEAHEAGTTRTTFADYIKVIRLDKASKKFDEWVAGGMLRREFSYPDQALDRPYTNESPEEILDWWFAQNRAGNDAVRHDNYTTWPELYSVFKCLWDVSSYYKDRNHDELVHTVNMYVEKHVNFKTFKRELDLVIDRIDSFDDDGNMIIDIIDHYLSEHGNSVYFSIKQDGTYAISNAYGELISGSLKDVFNYWQTHRYYGDDDE